jgi:hypothetical protein
MDGTDIVLPNFPPARHKNAAGHDPDACRPEINGEVLIRILSSMGVIHAFP